MDFNTNLWSNNNNTNLWSNNDLWSNNIWNLPNKKPVVKNKFITINNQNFVVEIKPSNSNNLYHSILTQVNTNNIEQDTISIREKLSTYIYQNCNQDINFKYKVFYYISTEWKDKWNVEFPEINNVKGDELITSYLKILKNNPQNSHNKLSYGGIMEIHFMSLWFNIKIGIINNNNIKFYNTNAIKTIYLFQENNDYFIAKLH